MANSKNYTYDQKTFTYHFHAKEKLGRDFKITKECVDSIVNLYSEQAGSAKTAKEISDMIKLPKEIVVFILRALNVTHSSLPVTDEVLSVVSEDELVSDLLKQKAFNVTQKAYREDWKKTQLDALKWQRFEEDKIKPFSKFLQNWKPPVLDITKKEKTLIQPKSDKVFVVALSDLHFGASANSRYMFNRPDWNTEKTVKAVEKYSREIIDEVNSRKYKFKKCVILSLGDQIHSVLGKTARGTELQFDKIKEEQFDYALNSLLVFIKRMVDVFGCVEVHDVGGNHHYELDMALFRALAMYFEKDKRITFRHHATRPASFRCDNTLIMFEHGADSKERVYVPNGGKLEKHVNNILINNPHLLPGTKTKLFIQGDRHHFEHLEFATFEFIMCGTILGSDEHAAVNNWHNRARQSCLILDRKGLREIVHVYFD